MSVRLDLTGQQFGRLTVIVSTRKRNKYNRLLWKCRCECGKTRYATTSDLKLRKVTTCGCRGRLDLKGKTFGRLTVIRETRKNNCIFWRCLCQCGKKTSVRTDDLISLSTQSCGCYRREIANQISRTHGDAGKITTRLYNIWHSMKQRCLNKTDKDYKNYGGRGIKLCKQWHDYVAFKKWALAHGYRNDLQIDRINNEGNYTPNNCRWVTRKDNLRNTRRTRWGTIEGNTKSLAEWCEIYDISYATVLGRLSRGWDLIDALTKPLCFSPH